MMRKLVDQSVTQIWSEHCSAKDGRMSYEEAQNFVNTTFGGIGQRMTQEDYDAIWKKVDKDNDRRINKGEMVMFLISLSKF